LDPTVAPAALKAEVDLLPPGSPKDLGLRSDASGSGGSGPKPVSNEEWAILERRMQSLGITQFTIEGVPGGRVFFSCLIPLAGRQAVAERFEAEGDDVLQTARAAMRRIALWRATQSSSD
jgi:hypothetical protein